jgi:hypothetical protein
MDTLGQAFVISVVIWAVFSLLGCTSIKDFFRNLFAAPGFFFVLFLLVTLVVAACKSPPGTVYDADYDRPVGETRGGDTW